LKDPIVRTRLLMVTKVADRFGNHVDYSYTNGELTSITASDGRSIVITYVLVGGKRRPTSATAHGRTWTYTYAGSGQTDPLISVTLPDGVSTWEYANVGVTAFRPNGLGGYGQRIDLLDGIVPGCTADMTPETATVRNPAGLLSTYTFQPTIMGRSDVDPNIYHDLYDSEHAIVQAVNC